MAETKPETPKPADLEPQKVPQDKAASQGRETGRDHPGGYGGSGFAGETGGDKTPPG